MLQAPLGAPVADDERAGRKAPLESYGLRQVAYDACYLARRPFTLGPRGRRKLYATLASAAGLYLLRDEIREAVQDGSSDGRSEFLDDVRTMGKGAFAPSLALIALGGSLITHNDREKETALLLMESMGYSAAAAYGGSFVLAAERPNEGDSIDLFDAAGHGVSLDAALAASVVPVLRRQYLRVRPGDHGGVRFGKRLGSAALYGGAVLTGFQRMDADEHWAPDVFLGLSAGFAVGKTLCDAHDEAHGPPGRVALGLQPGGLTLTIRLGKPLSP
ncbi:MAG: hypothetical protein GY716_18360 [bacterium]|nr:hypothetical protein [bacterium]